MPPCTAWRAFVRHSHRLGHRVYWSHDAIVVRKRGTAYAWIGPDEAKHGDVPQELRPLGFSGQQGRALVELASALAQRHVDMEALAGLDDNSAIRACWPCAASGAG